MCNTYNTVKFLKIFNCNIALLCWKANNFFFIICHDFFLLERHNQELLCQLFEFTKGGVHKLRWKNEVGTYVGGTGSVNSMQIFLCNSKPTPSKMVGRVVNNGQNLANVVCDRPLIVL